MSDQVDIKILMLGVAGLLLENKSCR
jgi:hypothetical protein